MCGKSSKKTQMVKILLEEAAQLKSVESQEATEQAIIKVEKALNYCGRSGDKRLEADAYQTLGEASEQLGELQKGLLQFEKSLGLATEIKDKKMQCSLLNKIATMQLYLGDNPKAWEAICKSGELCKGINDRREEAEYFNNLGEYYYFTTEMLKSIEAHHQALKLFQEIEDKRGEILSMVHLCDVYFQKGERAKAFQYYEQALARLRETSEIFIKGLTLRAGAEINIKMGDKQEAINLYEDALKIFQTTGNKVWQASTYTGIGTFYEVIGEAKKALLYRQKALSLYNRLGLRNAEVLTMMVLGKLSNQLGNSMEALHYYRQVERANLRLKDKFITAVLKYYIGLVYESREEYRQALNAYEEALAVSRGLELLKTEADVLSAMGTIQFTMGSRDKALNFFGQSLERYRQIKDEFGETKTLYEMALAERELSLFESAKRHIDEGIALIETLRENWKSPEIRTAYFSTAQKSFDLSINILMELHKVYPAEQFDKQAFELSERARARTLLESIFETEVNFRAGLDPALLKRERDLIKRMTDHQARTDNLSLRNKRLNGFAEQNEDWATELYQIRAKMRAANPLTDSSHKIVPKTVAEIQRFLDANTLLLEYRLGEKRSYLWAVTPQSLMSFELPPRAEIENQARAFYQSLVAPEETAINKTAGRNHLTLKHTEGAYQKFAEKLSAMLVAPVAALLPGKRLVIVADGALQYVPFAALPIPHYNPPAERIANSTASAYTPLILTNEIANLSSGSLIALLREDRSEVKAVNKSLALISDPIFTEDDTRFKAHQKEAHAFIKKPATAAQDASARFRAPALEYWIPKLDHLPFAAREAESIMENAKGLVVLKISDFNANKEKVLQTDFSPYSFVHFTTHGLVDNENPDLSSIVLSLYDQRRQPQDGLLQLQDIAGLKLHAELVVLSACKTALGKEFRGEGLISLNRGFMQAGAKRVMASLWDVDDASTAELMRRLYRGIFIEGLSPSASLRKAQATMSQERRWQSPYFWAAFVMQGEWR